MAKSTICSIRGFQEMTELLHEMYYNSVDQAADKVFDECCDIIKDSMDSYAAGRIPADLAAKQTEFRIKHGNRRMFAYGFSENDHESKMKACYLNYGTPRRTSYPGQPVMIDGKFVTLGQDRGKISPRYFISNGKRSAAQKINARKKAMLKQLLGSGKK